MNSTTNYGRARQFYMKANCLDMRNGRPFNMLAILAKISNRKFEAVYYNIRREALLEIENILCRKFGNIKKLKCIKFMQLTREIDSIYVT